MKKVLVANYVHPALLEGLQSLGFEVVYEPNFNPDDLEHLLPSLSGVVINTKIKMTQTRINMATQLEFIARLGSGLDIIDLPAAKAQGVAVFSAPEGNRNAVAEHALGMILNLANKLSRADRCVREKKWDRESCRGFELEGKTIGLIGFGNTGQAFASKVSSWTLDLIYNDPYVLNIPKGLRTFESVTIDQIWERADIISLHVQLTKETKRMIDANFLAQCKKGVIIVNTSRGDVVDTAALIEAMESNHVSGACLDVFPNEKPHTYSQDQHQLYDRLFAMENVVLSPHVAGWTHESLHKIATVLVDKIKRLDIEANVYDETSN